MARRVESPPAYQVPALEKGLDILECLAAQGVPLTQSQLARALGRGPNEVFRMLVCLERRGYIQRDAVSGAYSLTLRLFELSHTHSPYQGLLRAAARPMQRLTESVLESCHLSVIQRGKLLVLAQEESPRSLRLSTEVGGVFPLIHTASGRLLLAHLPADELDDLLAHDADYGRLGEADGRALRERLAQIRARGYEEATGETTEGVRVLAVLLGSPTGLLRAALTIPILGRKREPQHADLLGALRACAAEISRAAGLLAERNS
jgi:DNA-binding IclR family transcriptional regulator